MSANPISIDIEQTPNRLRECFFQGGIPVLIEGQWQAVKPNDGLIFCSDDTCQQEALEHEGFSNEEEAIAYYKGLRKNDIEAKDEVKKRTSILRNEELFNRWLHSQQPTYITTRDNLRKVINNGVDINTLPEEVPIRIVIFPKQTADEKKTIPETLRQNIVKKRFEDGFGDAKLPFFEQSSNFVDIERAYGSVSLGVAAFVSYLRSGNNVPESICLGGLDVKYHSVCESIYDPLEEFDLPLYYIQEISKVLKGVENQFSSQLCTEFEDKESYNLYVTNNCVGDITEAHEITAGTVTFTRQQIYLPSNALPVDTLVNPGSSKCTIEIGQLASKEYADPISILIFPVLAGLLFDRILAEDKAFRVGFSASENFIKILRQLKLVNHRNRLDNILSQYRPNTGLNLDDMKRNLQKFVNEITVFPENEIKHTVVYLQNGKVLLFKGSFQGGSFETPMYIPSNN